MQYIDSIIIISTLLAAVVLQIRRDRAEKKAKENISMKLTDDLINNEDLYPILWDLLTAIDKGRRVAITQFHNGGKYFSGNSINRMTMTHEVARKGLVHMSKDIKDIIITRPYSVTIDYCLENDVACYNDIDKITDDDLRNYIKYMDVKAIAFAMIRSSKGDPIGILHVSSDRQNVFSAPDMQGLMMRATKVASILESKKK